MMHVEEGTAPEPTADPVPERPPATVVFVQHDPWKMREMVEAAGERAGRWDVHYARSADEGIAHFDRLPTIDVLVADFDTPGVAGSDLLVRVRQRRPDTARIIVSDRRDREAVMRAMSTAAHQYLPAPLDIDQLAEVIDHVSGSTQTGLRDPVRALVGQVDQLPSPPALYRRLTEIMASSRWTIDEVAGEIAQDVALTGEILRLVNSSFFGTSDEVTSVQRAISLVGIDLIRFVVLGDKLYRSGDGPALAGWLELDRLDQRSKQVARAARALAMREGATSDACAAAYLTGMVSEIGLLVMARVPEISPSIAQPVNTGVFPGAERAIFGGDRFQVGGHLLRLWGFRSSVVDAVDRLARTDRPDDALGRYVADARNLVLEQGVAPNELEAPAGSSPEVDAAVRLVAA